MYVKDWFHVTCTCIYIVQCTVYVYIYIHGTMYVLKFGSMLHVYILYVELMQISPFPLPPSGEMMIVMTLHAGCPTALGTYRPIDCSYFFILHV